MKFVIGYIVVGGAMKNKNLTFEWIVYGWIYIVSLYILIILHLTVREDYNPRTSYTQFQYLI